MKFLIDSYSLWTSKGKQVGWVYKKQYHDGWYWVNNETSRHGYAAAASRAKAALLGTVKKGRK